MTPSVPVDDGRAARSWRSAVWLSIRSRPLEVDRRSGAARRRPHRHPAHPGPVQPTVGVDRAPCQARVVGVQAVRDVERAGRERLHQRLAHVGVEPQHGVHQASGLVQDLQ